MLDFEKILQKANERVEASKPCAQVEAVIIDANNLLYRLSHIERKVPDMVALGFVEKALMLSRWYGSCPEKTYIVWEGNSIENWRFVHHPEYKGTRKKSGDPELRACVREAEKILRSLLKETKFPQVDPRDSEGDDGFATLAKKLLEDGVETIGIYSTDRDLLQLALGEKVCLIVPQRGASDVAMFERDVRSNYGISPRQIQDVKALEGDVGDNIPGVKGIGKKYATAMIQSFGSCAGLLNAVEAGKLNQLEDETKKDWKERLKGAALTPARLDRLREGLDSAKMSYIIGGIRDDVELRFSQHVPTSEKRFFSEYRFLLRSRYLETNSQEFLNL